jgi:chaperonin cofactor prefoldin
LNIGESFIDATEDEARAFVEKQITKYNEQKKSLIEKYEANKKRIDDLKIILYAKFGRSVNLEED